MSSKRDRNRSEQRQRILNAARMLFDEQSFDQVTMSDVAGQAGVARATVFNYFPSKYSLVEAITEDVFAYFRAMLEAALGDEQSPTPDLVRALFLHMGALDTNRTFYTGVFREMMKIQFGLDEGGAAQRMRAVTVELLVKLMERGQARGDIAPNPPPLDLAYAFESLSNGTIVRWLYEDASVSLIDRMRTSAEIFLGQVAVAPDAARREELPELVTTLFNIPPPEGLSFEELPATERGGARTLPPKPPARNAPDPDPQD
jgi:AcrR family transcriptional regulator